MRIAFLALLLINVLFFVGTYRPLTAWFGAAGPESAAATAEEVPKLTLASEVNDSQPPTSDVKTATPQQLPETEDAPVSAPGTESAPVTTAQCVSIGAFHDLPEATQASTSLRTAGYRPRTRAMEGEVWAGLWVYLEDLATRTEAQNTLALLKQNGIADAYIMPSSEATTDISLGLFSEPARAQHRAQDARALGLKPTVADRTRKGTVYWLEMDLKPGDKAPDPALIQGDSGRILRLKVQPCAAKS